MRAQTSVVSRSWRVVLTSLVFTLWCVGCGRASVESGVASPQAMMVAPAPPAEPAVAETESMQVADSSEVSFDKKSSEPAGEGAGKGSLIPKSQPAKSSSSARGVASTQGAKESAEPDETATKGQKAPLLIYKAEVALAVFEVNKGLDAVEKIAREAQGYLVSRRDDTIVVRVPAAGFDGSLQAILKLGDVLKRDLQVEDVTAQMNDLTTRLKNAEAMRARLEQLLKTATTTEDALKVEEQLGRVTGEIESLKGKIRLMSELVSFSTITVSFRPTVTETVTSKFKLPFPWLEELGLSRLLSL